MVVSTTATTAAFLSTAAISLAPNLILLLFPGYAAGEGEKSVFLSLGQATAVGGLLGDVFLHTLPHAEDQETAGLWVLAGFTLFLTADLIIRSLDGHHHHHDHKAHPVSENGNGSNKYHHQQEEECTVNRSTVLLNLAADALHNFTDGLAIGASYSLHKSEDAAGLSLTSLITSRGGLASISILFHEVPHELGDFCTLVRAGYSKFQAVMAQFCTAIAAFLGTAVALSVSQEGRAADRLLFITAGGFIYLAGTTILPEVLEDETSSFGRRMAQLAAFCAGIGFLYIVALLETNDEHHHHHHHHEHSVDHHHHHHDEHHEL